MQVIHYTTEENTDVYQEWVDALRDARARVAILRRVDRAVAGNFGDHKPCRKGVLEMRINEGSGYRVYYFQHGQTIVVLLCGGDKKNSGCGHPPGCRL
ncbi:MAG: type II toxin-antitoxin system RelE/ParE family toxin [Desulfovibrio sp.]|jgi:putative addiction module killer protein|nr:type II toxin-antitoxin system RelE/ParE family toxin [Desulfovibrio sp.]